jgi:hypothetical protein
VLELRKTTECHRDDSRFSNRYSQTSSYVLFYIYTLYKELLEIRTVICDGMNSDSLAACHELSMQYVRRRRGTRGRQNSTNTVLCEQVGFPVTIVIPPQLHLSIPRERYRAIVSRRSSEIHIITAFHKGTKKKRCAG